MEYKSMEMFTKQIEDRTVTGFASIFGNIDSYGDIVHNGAFKKTIQENGDRVRHLWMHDLWSPPTAAIKELREVGKRDLPKELKEKYPQATGGLLVIREYLDTPRGNEILSGIKSDAIREMSFGYDTVKWEIEESDDGKDYIRHLKELRLWDTSDVNFGANQATVASKTLQNFWDEKAAVPYKDTGTAAEDTEWSAPTLSDFTGDSWDELSDSEKRRIAAHFAWSANMPPETYGDLKLPHHKPASSGIGPAIWRGVSAAMGALLGARGGVDIPSGDRRSVYNHLSKHYDQYDKEPPDFKLVELAALVISLKTDDFSVNLSTSNLERFKAALDELSAILTAAEPPEDAKDLEALTEQVMAKLAIYDRELTLINL